MTIHTLEATHLGPIEHAQVRFGDLTVFVGPQATGKSILLQFLKLVLDSAAIVAEMRRQGLDWQMTDEFLDIYLGEGMSSIWSFTVSNLAYDDNKRVILKTLIGGTNKKTPESLFFIPAQRVLTLGRGWPRPFSDYNPGDPFVVRDFSEKIRTFLTSGSTNGKMLFPQTGRLRPEFRDLLQETIFGKFGLRVDLDSGQKRLGLGQPNWKGSFPFMVWSSGQREFVPLLLGFYWLLPPTTAKRRTNLQWVVIEEPEMGLHPRAISAVLLLVLELLSRGYRVCISTHSPHVLDLIWALKVFQQNHASPEKLLELFEINATSSLKTWASKILKKDARVYYFDPKSHETRDISELDPGSEDIAMSGWGGLTEFSGRVGDVVADVVNGSTR